MSYHITLYHVICSRSFHIISSIYVHLVYIYTKLPCFANGFGPRKHLPPAKCISLSPPISRTAWSPERYWEDDPYISFLGIPKPKSCSQHLFLWARFGVSFVIWCRSLWFHLFSVPGIFGRVRSSGWIHISKKKHVEQRCLEYDLNNKKTPRALWKKQMHFLEIPTKKSGTFSDLPKNSFTRQKRSELSIRKNTSEAVPTGSVGIY